MQWKTGKARVSPFAASSAIWRWRYSSSGVNSGSCIGLWMSVAGGLSGVGAGSGAATGTIFSPVAGSLSTVEALVFCHFNFK